MNTIRTITSVLTPILLTTTLVGYRGPGATAATTPEAVPTSSPNWLAADSKTPHAAQTVPTSPQVVAQGSSIRDRGSIRFPLGATTASATNFVAGNGIDRYTFSAAGGQSASINISSQTGQVLLTLIAPDGTPIIRAQSGGASWSGILPMNGTYRIEAVNQYFGSRYTVNVNIQPVGGGGNRAQIHDRGSIEFPAGGTFASIDGYLAPQNIDRYHFTARAGQTANLYVGSPNSQVLLTLIDPNGNPIVRYQGGANSWAGSLPADGIYQVDVVNQASASSYNLGLSIR